MSRFRPSTDVRPVTEFRSHTSAVLEQVHSTKRPVILTHHGRSTAVLLDVELYEEMLDEISLLRDVRTGESQISSGQGIAHTDVEARLRDQYLK